MRWEEGDWTDDSDQMILILDSILAMNGEVCVYIRLNHKAQYFFSFAMSIGFFEYTCSLMYARMLHFKKAIVYLFLLVHVFNQFVFIMFY